MSTSSSTFRALAATAPTWRRGTAENPGATMAGTQTRS
jgi:hypothetical protein